MRVDEMWPPVFTLDQEAILNLLTGDRFYSNPSAALREAVLNAIDATHRRRTRVPDASRAITVSFQREPLRLEVSDNGIGMSKEDITALFTKVGASAATAEAKKESVGEFGIGVISYFMAGDAFTLETYDGAATPLGLGFDRGMLAGGKAKEINPSRTQQGTTVVIHIRDEATFTLLLESFAHWCRDVEGLSGTGPDGGTLEQGGRVPVQRVEPANRPLWVEGAHLAPVADPTGWEAMTGMSNVSVLYRGVFVQEFEVQGLWGIQGSINVNPKHFKPKLNREGFISGAFQSEVQAFLRQMHPSILESMASRLRESIAAGVVDKWTEKKWANLWLSVPRSAQYSRAVEAWDSVFRSLPAFEIAVGNRWEPASIERLASRSGEIYVAPLDDERPSDIVKAATRLLRLTGKTVIRGIRKERNWMRPVSAAFGTTADLVASVFGSELPPLLPIVNEAEHVLAGLARVGRLFTGPPPVDLVRLGGEGPPALRLKDRLVINIEHAAGVSIVTEVLEQNSGPYSMISVAARHAHEQLTQVAAVVREIGVDAEILSPVRRRHIRACLK